MKENQRKTIGSHSYIFILFFLYFKNIFYPVTLENIFKKLNNSVYFQNIVLCNEPFRRLYIFRISVCVMRPLDEKFSNDYLEFDSLTLFFWRLSILRQYNIIKNHAENEVGQLVPDHNLFF